MCGNLGDQICILFKKKKSRHGLGYEKIDTKVKHILNRLGVQLFISV